jgi:bifunctional oligoribonuclease and PAP phosphatase NrnA
MTIPTNDYRRAIELIESAGRILVTTHIRPDGDAIGCLAAMKAVLESLPSPDGSGRRVQSLFLSPVGDIYRFLVPSDAWFLGEQIKSERIQAGCLDDFDLAIVCDTSARRQLDCVFDALQKRTKPVLVIDHHLSGDGLGQCRLIDTAAAAAGEIVYELCDRAGWPIHPTAAEALFTAITTDTGWFHFENTTPRALRIAAELIEAGLKPDQLYQRLFMQDPPERLQLLALALQTLELHCDGKLALMHITKAMLQRAGAKHWQIENIVNEPMRIGTTLVSILMVEQEDGDTRCSFRSKAVVDVNAVAATFGGGGHARAAGAILNMPLDQARQNLIPALQNALAPPTK